MTINEPLSTVVRMFAAFRAGDVEGILETAHSDSRWTYSGANPTSNKREFVGHANVRRFFEGILRRPDMTAFDRTEFVVQDNTVVVLVASQGPSGTQVRRSATSGCRSMPRAPVHSCRERLPETLTGRSDADSAM